MTFKEIQELVKLVNKTNLTEFKLKDGDFELSLRTDEYIKAKFQSRTATPQLIPVSQAAAPTPAPAPTPEAAPSAKAPAQTKEAASEEAANDNYIEIKSPIVGTFYRSSSPEKPPYIQIGDKIGKDSVVCIIEAMKLFNEIEAEVSGTIVKVLVEDAQPVEYDQPLFLIDPS